MALNLQTIGLTSVIVSKGKRYQTSRAVDVKTSSFEALLAESRALREQVADELDREAWAIPKVSTHLGRSRRSSSSTEQSG